MEVSKLISHPNFELQIVQTQICVENCLKIILTGFDA